MPSFCPLVADLAGNDVEALAVIPARAASIAALSASRLRFVGNRAHEVDDVKDLVHRLRKLVERVAALYGHRREHVDRFDQFADGVAHDADLRRDLLEALAERLKSLASFSFDELSVIDCCES